MRPDPSFRGTMAAKKRAAKKSGRGELKTNPRAFLSSSVGFIAAQNLVNMVAVFAASGAVLLGLLFARHL
jgi:hypothetical protein